MIVLAVGVSIAAVCAVVICLVVAVRRLRQRRPHKLIAAGQTRNIALIYPNPVFADQSAVVPPGNSPAGLWTGDGISVNPIYSASAGRPSNTPELEANPVYAPSAMGKRHPGAQRQRHELHMPAGRVEDADA